MSARTGVAGTSIAPAANIVASALICFRTVPARRRLLMNPSGSLPRHPRVEAHLIHGLRRQRFPIRLLGSPTHEAHDLLRQGVVASVEGAAISVEQPELGEYPLNLL